MCLVIDNEFERTSMPSLGFFLVGWIVLQVINLGSSGIIQSTFLKFLQFRLLNNNWYGKMVLFISRCPCPPNGMFF